MKGCNYDGPLLPLGVDTLNEESVCTNMNYLTTYTWKKELDMGVKIFVNGLHFSPNLFDFMHLIR